MENKINFGIRKQFAKEFNNYPIDQQNKISKFVAIYKKNGLKNFKKYEGKISPSWRNAKGQDESYALRNNLWHYHIGIPEYKDKKKYKTSKMILHFQWYKNEKEEFLYLVDINDHYDSNKKFILPFENYLE